MATIVNDSHISAIPENNAAAATTDVAAVPQPDNKLYKNKYWRKFIESSQDISATNETGANTSYEHCSNEWQDPTIIGFTIKFDFNEIFDEGDYDNLNNSLLMGRDSIYSAINYLENINEPVRAKYLENFIATLKNIQTNTPWYYQSVTGLDKLFTINPKTAWRPGPDTAITIEMLESIDLRISLLMDLYKKAAWDAEYMRWMLPENMRWFKIHIILSEVRNFHISAELINLLPSSTNIDSMSPRSRSAGGATHTAGGNIFTSVGNSKGEKALEQLGNSSSVMTGVKNLAMKGERTGNIIEGSFKKKTTDNSVPNVYSNAQNSFLPLHVITLDMCEFKILETTFPYAGNVTDYGDNAKQQLVFNVGRINRTSNYTLHDLVMSDIFPRMEKDATKKFTAEEIGVLTDKGNYPYGIKKQSVKSNYLLDKAKSAATTYASDKINSLVASLFLGNAFDGDLIDKVFKNQKEASKQILAGQIETLYLAKEKITGDDTKKNIKNTGHAYTKSIYQGDENIELETANTVIDSSEQIANIKETGHASTISIHKDNNNLLSENQTILKMPDNIGFNLPDTIGEPSDSLELKVPDVRKDMSKNIGLDEDKPDTTAGGNIELKEP